MRRGRIDAALDLLEAGIVPLVAMPGAAGKRGARRLLLRRFPYAVIVRESDTEVLPGCGPRLSQI